MDMLGQLMLRLILVPFAAVIAFAVIPVVMMVGMMIGAWIASPPGLPHDLPPPFILPFVLALLYAKITYNMLRSTFAFYALVVAAIGVLISETFAVRSWIFHAANGTLSVWIAFAATADSRSQLPLTGSGIVAAEVATVATAAGLVAGLVYWIVAGRTAGFWKPIGKMPWRPEPPA